MMKLLSLFLLTSLISGSHLDRLKREIEELAEPLLMTRQLEPDMENACSWFRRSVSKVQDQEERVVELEHEIDSLKHDIRLNSYRLREMAHVHKHKLSLADLKEEDTILDEGELTDGQILTEIQDQYSQIDAQLRADEYDLEMKKHELDQLKQAIEYWNRAPERLYSTLMPHLSAISKGNHLPFNCPNKLGFTSGQVHIVPVCEHDWKWENAKVTELIVTKTTYSIPLVDFVKEDPMQVTMREANRRSVLLVNFVPSSSTDGQTAILQCISQWVSKLSLDHPGISGDERTLRNQRQIRRSVAFQFELATQQEFNVMVVNLGRAEDYKAATINEYIQAYIHYSRIYSGHELRKIVLVYDAEHSLLIKTKPTK